MKTIGSGHMTRQGGLIMGDHADTSLVAPGPVFRLAACRERDWLEGLVSMSSRAAGPAALVTMATFMIRLILV